MAERFKAAVLKTASPERRRRFESYSLRQNFSKKNFGRESKIEIRDVIVQDFRFGQISIFDFQKALV